MGERWFLGIFLGKKDGTEENIMMQGERECRAGIRELQKMLTLKDCNVLPGTLARSDRNFARELREVQQESPKEDFAELRGTRRVQIRREVVGKFVPSLDCEKCRSLLARDCAYQYKHHREECRTRMEALMRDDDGFRRHVESADLCLTKRLAGNQTPGESRPKAVTSRNRTQRRSGWKSRTRTSTRSGRTSSKWCKSRRRGDG